MCIRDRSCIVRHLAAPASHTFMSFMRTTARMISAAGLLARYQSLLLIGSEQAFAFLHSLLADLAHLLLFLLGSEGRVGADVLDRRMCVVRDGMNLFHHRFFNAGLL